MTGRAPNGHVVLNEHPIVNDGKMSRNNYSALFSKTRSGENDIISLPFSRLAGSIDQRDMLFVNGSYIRPEDMTESK